MQTNLINAVDLKSPLNSFALLSKPQKSPVLSIDSKTKENNDNRILALSIELDQCVLELREYIFGELSQLKTNLVKLNVLKIEENFDFQSHKRILERQIYCLRSNSGDEVEKEILCFRMIFALVLLEKVLLLFEQKSIFLAHFYMEMVFHNWKVQKILFDSGVIQQILENVRHILNFAYVKKIF